MLGWLTVALNYIKHHVYVGNSPAGNASFLEDIRQNRISFQQEHNIEAILRVATCAHTNWRTGMQRSKVQQGEGPRQRCE
jgi:hypothetical protein